MKPSSKLLWRQSKTQDDLNNTKEGCKVSILIGLCIVAIGFITIVAGVIVGECLIT